MNRVRTTHVGSLPRPRALLDLMKTQAEGERGADGLVVGDFEAQLRLAVTNCVQKQADAGIDILTDGEQSKPGFFSYVRDRLEGFEPRPHQRTEKFAAEVAAFPEYYEQYFKRAMLGGAVVPSVPLVCTGPIKYRGEAALKRDIDNLKAASANVSHHAVF